MPPTKRIQFEATILAPVPKVFETLIRPDTYREWTSAFAEGSYFEGSWGEGQRIRFLSPSGDGMLAEIAELRPNEFISIRHLGFIANGVEDTDSDAVRAWAPAYENYTFLATDEGTRLVVDQDVTEDFESAFNEMWPKALRLLKAICERPGAG